MNLEVKHIFQSEVEDTFSIYNKDTHELIIEKFPRSMGLTCEDVLSYYE